MFFISICKIVQLPPSWVSHEMYNNWPIEVFLYWVYPSVHCTFIYRIICRLIWNLCPFVFIMDGCKVGSIMGHLMRNPRSKWSKLAKSIRNPRETSEIKAIYSTEVIIKQKKLSDVSIVGQFLGILQSQQRIFSTFFLI